MAWVVPKTKRRKSLDRRSSVACCARIVDPTRRCTAYYHGELPAILDPHQCVVLLRKSLKSTVLSKDWKKRNSVVALRNNQIGARLS